jgi:Lon protease-like protein
VQVCERWRCGISVLHAVGCLAEVQRVQWDTTGAMQAVCRGTQRVTLTSIAGTECPLQLHGAPYFVP